MKDKISIIVPIYNVSRQLEKCINSLLNQTYGTIEIILVDDGSTDQSLSICQKYSEKDIRIKVIHKKNGGITSARKAGVSVSEGNYIGFVDGDDWVEPDMYEKLYSYCKNNDVQIAASGMYRDDDEGTYVDWPAGRMEPGLYKDSTAYSKFLDGLFREGSLNMSGSLNNKLFDVMLLKKYLMEVDDRIHGFEDDTVCTLPCILFSNGIYITNEAYYHGYDRSDSVTHTKNERWYEQLNLVYLRLKDCFQHHEKAEFLLNNLKYYITNGIMNGIPQLFEDASFYGYFWKTEQRNQKKIILYGAGKVGRSYYSQFQMNHEYEIVLWVDKNYQKMNSGFASIYGPEKIKDVEFDQIIIAVNREKDAQQITEMLMQYDIPETKIKWQKPTMVSTLFFRGNEKDE